MVTSPVKSKNTTAVTRRYIQFDLSAMVEIIVGEKIYMYVCGGFFGLCPWS